MKYCIIKKDIKANFLNEEKYKAGAVLSDLQLNNIDVILSFIKKENERQIKKWGIQTHNAVVWDTILNEEVGELTKDMLQIYKSEPEKIQQHFDSAFREAIQVATLSLKIAEMLNNLINKNNENNEM